jgi:hypothetical protein
MFRGRQCGGAINQGVLLLGIWGKDGLDAHDRASRHILALPWSHIGLMMQ